MTLHHRTVRDLSWWHAWWNACHVGTGGMVLPWTGSTVFLLESLMSLLTSPELRCFQLFEMELLTFLDQLLSLVFQTFALAFHRRFELFEMSQFNLQFLHLRLHQQRNKTFDLSLFNRRKMLCFHSSTCQCRRCRRLKISLVKDLPRFNATLLLLARAFCCLLVRFPLTLSPLRLDGVLLIGCFGIRFFIFISFDLWRFFF